MMIQIIIYMMKIHLKIPSRFFKIPDNNALYKNYKEFLNESSFYFFVTNNFNFLVFIATVSDS